MIKAQMRIKIAKNQVRIDRMRADIARLQFEIVKREVVRSELYIEDLEPVESQK